MKKSRPPAVDIAKFDVRFFRQYMYNVSARLSHDVTMQLQDAVEEFEARVFTEPDSPLVLCAMSLAGTMEEVKPLLQ